MIRIKRTPLVIVEPRRNFLKIHLIDSSSASMSKLLTKTFNVRNIIPAILFQINRVFIMDSKKSPYFSSLVSEESISGSDQVQKETNLSSKRQTRSSTSSCTTSKTTQFKAKLKVEKQNDATSNNMLAVTSSAKKITRKNVKEEVLQPWQPENWEVVFENIRSMRLSRDAPVDSMGAEKSVDPNTPPEVLNLMLTTLGIQYMMNIHSIYLLCSTLSR